MDGNPAVVVAERRSPWPLAAALVLLVVVNLLNNVLAPGGYLVWAGLGVAGLVLLARADGLLPRQWGLRRVDRTTALASLVVCAVTIGVMLLATRLPGVESAFVDERVSGMGPGEVAYSALVRAPLGTALLEETAFRGVLLAMLVRRLGPGRAVALSSLAFGIWHVVPALGVSAGNAAVGSLLGSQPMVAVAAAILASGLAGAFLCLLRMRFDHLLVPFSMHATANASAYLLAGWVAAG